ncbi:efflux RND transporter periplasmic adaptor subunit [Geminisphaera colitermitum]|uniref:efflux RND transporter periplasmic adaptor subunit n=1 Tax=Geminisphaera colitermitum TaxID=1148786 RepID=UPI00019650A2|nr:efflux RND transporter periplasmic adaptor subunit [Geminisphaera colitermitum]
MQRLLTAALPLIAATAALLFQTACSDNKNAAHAGGPGAGAAPAATDVGVVTLTAEPITLTRSLPGRTSAYRIAEVRARVNGIVQKRFFTEGTNVKEGDQLYQIDPEPYEAALASAEATLARAQATHAAAQLDVQRYADLVKLNAVSRQNYDDALSAEKIAAADIAAAQAAIKTAKINLAYTKVYAPISGHIGKSEITEGAYVQAATATLLSTIQQIDKLYVDVVQPANNYLKLRADLESGRLKAAADGKSAPVKLILTGGAEYPESGTLEFTDITVDPGTSSITVRALFPNPRGDLYPGLFVHARLVEGVKPSALLVPQTGVSRNTKGQATALIVGKDNKVELRILTAERTIGDKWLVTSGVSDGDQVIVENLQRIRPGVVVNPIPPSWQKPAGTVEPIKTESPKN